MIKELAYNLPGYGFANCFLLGQAIELLEMLKSNNVLDKMKNTCQLGTMKYVYPGAHHTRYEYVFTQLMLISNIVSVDYKRNIELSLSANIGEYESIGYKISGGAVMQCLAILSSAGHMYDTFTASRILLCVLRESKKEKTQFYEIYRRNLPNEVRRKFDDIIQNGNYYKLHLFHIIHILQGMIRSKYNKTCELCIKLVCQLIEPNLIKNEATQRIIFLYKKIRKIAYLSVDMVYTPASFGANLSRMIYSISSYVDDLFDENSAMNKAIGQLEDIIHQQIYDSPLCILNTNRIEQENLQNYRLMSKKVNDIFKLREFLLEKNDFEALHSTVQPKGISSIDSKATLLISTSWNSKTESYNLINENKRFLSLPATRIAYGTQLAQNLSKKYTAYGLLSLKFIQKDVQSIISNAILENSIENNNKSDIIKYAISSLYEYGKYFFNITSPIGVSIDDCIFIGNGCKKIAKEIRKRFTTDIAIKNTDQLHEIISCASVLENLEYSGLVVCFVGSIKASKYEKTEKIDELDGLIYLPNRETNSNFAYIIEAKNYSGGEDEAEKQLKNTVKYLSPVLSTEIFKLHKCAYMAISVRE